MSLSTDQDQRAADLKVEVAYALAERYPGLPPANRNHILAYLTDSEHFQEVLSGITSRFSASVALDELAATDTAGLAFPEADEAPEAVSVDLNDTTLHGRLRRMNHSRGLV